MLIIHVNPLPSNDSYTAHNIQSMAKHVTACFFILTDGSLASFLWDIGKLCRTRPDAAECGV